jgi:tetratricopeptide (TPR) repeat protein
MRPAVATFLFLAALAARPQTDPRARFEHAKELLQIGKYDSAAAEFTDLLNTAPDSPLLYNLLGFCYLKQNILNRAEENFQHSISLKPDFKAAHNNLGGLYLLQGEVVKAIEEFTAVLKIDPRDANVQKTVFDLAQSAFQKQEYARAISLLKLVEAAMANAAPWHEMMGYSEFKLHDTGNAIAEIQTAMDLDARNEDYILELSEVFVANNNGGAAVTLLTAAEKAHANSARILFALGVAYLVDENLPSAEAALGKSLELDPKLDLALVVLGQGYKEAGQWKDLLETSERLIQVNERNPAGYYYKALALLEIPSHDDAQIETLLKKSVALRAEEPGPHYELAKLLANKGDKEAALRELEQIVRAHPDFGPAYYQLYRLYRAKGTIEKSLEAKQAYARIKASERDQVTRKLLLQVRQRDGAR